MTSDLLPCGKKVDGRWRSSLKHGHTIGRRYSPTYHSWQAMLARCRYEARDTQAKHIGRGISVCDRWLMFENFLIDMGERPAGATLDRKNNDLGYSADNCRWATPTEQARNRRNAKMTYETALEAALMVLRGARIRDVAAAFRCSESLPREIVKGRAWADASAAAHSIWKDENARGS